MRHKVVFSTTGGPDVLEYVPADMPVPGPQDVVVRNSAAGVNYIDTIIRSGQMPAGLMPALPHVLGVEGSGIVESIGADVASFAPGDRVVWMGPVGSGGYADHSVLRPGLVAKLPDSTPLDIAAALPVAGITAWQLLVRIARVKAGDTVLVRGAAGGVGTLLIQLAKHLGAHVIAVTSSSKVEFVRTQGADHALSYADDSVAEEVLRLTGGRGVDIACNPVSGPTILEDMECLAPFGRLLIFGFLAGTPQGAFDPDLVRHIGRSIGVHVSDVYTLLTADPTAFAAALQEVVELFGAGILRPAVHARFGLRDARMAHLALERSEPKGKILLTTGG